MQENYTFAKCIENLRFSNFPLYPEAEPSGNSLIKSHMEVRPIRHWRARRIEAHLQLCYLSLWLSKYIENQWRQSGITTQVTPTLKEWDEQLVLCEKVDPHGTMTELKWNRGRNASAAIQHIKDYGEMEAIKTYL